MTQFQLFDELPADEFAALKEDIAKRGVLVPVEYDQDGAILDGHHRARICAELGITDFPTVVRRFDSDAEREEHIVTLNVRRRHLNGEQKRKWVAWFLERHPEWSNRKVAAEVGVSDPTVASVREDLEAAGEVLKFSTRVGKDGVSQPATKPTVFTSSRQAARAQQALTELGDDAPARQMDTHEAVQYAARQKQPAQVAEPVPPRDGTYRCIVIDPPWPMKKIERRERPTQGLALDYPVLTLEQLADESTVPVLAHADDDCHMYLWVTHKFLPDGLDLMATWGFRYQCVMTWRKNVGITPYSWMYDTEHVLFGTRGNLKLDQLGLRLSFDAPTQGHSVKPDVFYERVLAASPGPRLEMFARRPREGFDVWGNEVAR